MNIVQFFQEEGRQISLNTSEFVFRQGEEDRNLYFLKEGLLKAHYCLQDGSELIKSFVIANSIIGNLVSAHAGKACSFSLSCLEPCAIIRINYTKLEQQSKLEHSFSLELNQLLVTYALKKEQREYEFLCLNAEQRYRLLLAEEPTLLRRVTQQDVARYLGITPVGLSRIKKRVEQHI